MEVPLEYMNKLANQVVFVSALLGGFSLSAIIMLIEKTKDRLILNLFRLASVAASSFVVCIFCMTKIIMMTTPGFPIEFENADLTAPKGIGFTALLIGIVSMMGLISLSGWTKSRSLGIFTTVLGVIATLLILSMM